MIKTVEAMIDEKGNVTLLEPVGPGAARRALVTILEEPPVARAAETALLSEESLAEDWNRPDEDKAWSHLLTRPSRSRPDRTPERRHPALQPKP